jgi:hypothetical protein
MNADLSSAAVLTPVEEDENSTAEVCASSSQWAELEFQATLQLLAERARFLTGASGVAIALQQEDRLAYFVAVGDNAPEPGVSIDLSKSQIAPCVTELKPARAELAGASQFTLVVPIIRDSNFAGCFELLGQTEFEERDAQAVIRLATLLTTAIEFRDAAIRAARHDFDDLSQLQPMPPLWHAPEPVQRQAPEPDTAAPTSVADVHKCASCGFPVSGRRALCLECEQKADAAQPVPEVLTIPAHESWISAHGYTIASLLMTALAIAIIVWLRR